MLCMFRNCYWVEWLDVVGESFKVSHFAVQNPSVLFENSKPIGCQSLRQFAVLL